jgi:hypothetical protein
MTENGNAERTLVRRGGGRSATTPKGLGLLEGALCGAKEGAAQPGMLCIVEVGRFVELAPCRRVEA